MKLMMMMEMVTRTLKSERGSRGHVRMSDWHSPSTQHLSQFLDEQGSASWAEAEWTASSARTRRVSYLFMVIYLIVNACLSAL